MISIEEYIAWQAKQPNQFGGTVGELWTKQGITDPANNVVLRSQADEAIKTAYARAAIISSYKLPWGDVVTLPTSVVAGPINTVVQSPKVEIIANTTPTVTSNNKKTVIIIVVLIAAALALSKVFGLI